MDTFKNKISLFLKLPLDQLVEKDCSWFVSDDGKMSLDLIQLQIVKKIKYLCDLYLAI